MKLYDCPNCEFVTTTVGDLVMHPKDIFERVAPGEIMPRGECPECGALVHEEAIKPLKKKSRPITKTRLLDHVRLVRAAASNTGMEAQRLCPISVPHHQMRMQSILGASVIKDMRDAQRLIESAARKIRSIRKEV